MGVHSCGGEQQRKRAVDRAPIPFAARAMPVWYTPNSMKLPPAIEQLKRVLWFPIAASLVIGCSTAEEGGSPPAGDTDGPTPPAVPTPFENGGLCESAPVYIDEVYGWQTECTQSSSLMVITDSQTGISQSYFGDTGLKSACCMGKPEEIEADAACLLTCRRERCELAQTLHEALVEETGCFQLNGCSFDFVDCLDGYSLQSFWPIYDGDPPTSYSYEINIGCTAESTEPRHPDGTFAFINQPENNIFDDPPICGTPPDGQPPGSGNFIGKLAVNLAVEDAGTAATAEWTLDGEGGTALNSDVEVDVGYSLAPCASSDCFDLSTLTATIPSFTLEGLTINRADLSVIAVRDKPVLSSTGAFTFPAGSLEAILSATIDGTIPLALFATNDEPVTGRALPGSDLLSLSNMDFSFAETGFVAALELDVQARYTERAPLAAIRQVSLPRSCTDHVVLTAASRELDGQAMTHNWWIPGLTSVTGPSLEVPVPSGNYLVALTSIDSRGNADTDVLWIRRTCT